MSENYTYVMRSDGKTDEWAILRTGKHGLVDDYLAPAVWSCPYDPTATNDGQPPLALRLKYEELIGWTPSAEPEPSPANVVEMMADGEDCAWDQPCSFGHRVEDHAVYCHNTQWLYAPRKCRRHQRETWGGAAWPHEGCPGFRANPLADPEKSW